MARRTRTLLITAVATVGVLIPAAGASAGTLDQQQTLGTFGGLQVDNGNSKAQTFTAGITGQLDQVDLGLSGISLTTPLTVQIRDGSATTPGNTVLATSSIPTSAVSGSTSFASATFASPVSVTAGTQYSIVAMNDSAGWFWTAGISPDPPPASAYEGGKLYGSMVGPPAMGTWTEGNTQADFMFKTYVVPTPPPPPAGSTPSTPAPTCTTAATLDLARTSTACSTGQRAAALANCDKKKNAKKRKKCRRKANQLPV